MPDDPDSNVIPLFYDEAVLEEAWEQFNRAMLHQVALFEDKTASRAERFEASKEAARLERVFRRVCSRTEFAKPKRA